MLDRMREGSQGVAAKIILIVIILTFALAGVSSYLGGSSSVAEVVVNGDEISQSSVEQAYKSKRAQLQNQYGEQFDLIASTPNFASRLRAQVTQELISDRLVAQAINKMGFKVGDAQVKDAIRNMTEFQIDGKFNNESYLALLRRANYTPAQFADSLKYDIARQQLIGALIESEFVLPNEVITVNRLQAQKRLAKTLNVHTNDFINLVEINDEQVKNYFDENTDKFQEPEQASLNYILIDANELGKTIIVTNDDAKNYYEDHQTNFQTKERRKVAHILIKDDLAKVQKLLEELAAGANFEKVASANSQDLLTAKKGGELNWFELGDMDPAFDKAAFALTKDSSISGIVKSKFGYHIIKLLDIQKGQLLPFEQVEMQVKNSIKKERQIEQYDELKQILSEVAFESPDSLDEASKAVSMTIQHSNLFSANNAPMEFSNNSILRSVFNESFRNEGVNSDLIELTDNKAVVFRVNEYKDSSLRTIDSVSDEIRTVLKNQKARELAKNYTKSLVSKLQNNTSIDQELLEKKYKFSDHVIFSRFNPKYDNLIVEKLFKLPRPLKDSTSIDWVANSTGDHSIIILENVIDAQSLNPNANAQIKKIMERSTSEVTYELLLSLLRDEAEIKYLVKEK